MTANSETESLKQRLDDLHQQSEELEALLQNRSSIEVIDEDVPLVEIDGVEMIPVEQVEAWISPLQERIDELTDLAEQHREQRESLEQELNGLKRQLSLQLKEIQPT